MDWVYETLIVGCLAYAGAIVIDYVNYRDGITPRIQRIERGVIDIGLDFVSEEEAINSNFSISKIGSKSGFKVEKTVIEARGLCHSCASMA